MKIAMIGEFNPDCSHSGGITSHIYTLSQKLIQKGHEVFIITHPKKNNQKKKKNGRRVGGGVVLALRLLQVKDLILQVLEY